jgi:rhamnogalacturonan acetylesterase
MIDGAKSKGATPVISSTTPTNPYETSDTVVFTPGRVSYFRYSDRHIHSRHLVQFVTYAKDAAAAKGVPYVDHFYVSYLPL